MKNPIITDFEQKNFKGKKLPKFRPGDTVRVHYRLRDGVDPAKSRIQQFEGVVIRYKKGTESEAGFVVRKISAGGIGVERCFPVASPNIDKLEVKSRGIVRRSRLFYLRDLTGKSARIRARFDQGSAADMVSSEYVAETESSEVESSEAAVQE